jgi:hypothetical protein
MISFKEPNKDVISMDILKSKNLLLIVPHFKVFIRDQARARENEETGIKWKNLIYLREEA